MTRPRARSEVFFSLNQQSKGPSGETIRIRALEWLRLESLRRADLTQAEKQTYRDDLQQIRYRRHDRLIDLRRKNVIWVYPYQLPPLKRARAVEYVAGGSRWRDPRRAYVSFDPALSERVLLAAFKKIITENKAARWVRGAGRRYSLAKLWEALQLYDASKAPNVSLIDSD